MKRLLIGLFLLTALAAQAQEPAESGKSKEIVKDGWNFGPLPCVSYNSDLGFQYGVCADIFNYKGVFPDYRQRFYVEASRYTGGQTLLHLQFDSKYLIPGIRTTMSASWQYDPMFLFYGFNGLEPYDKTLAADKANRTARYAYKRSMVRVLADFQGNITPHLFWTAGLSYWYYKTGDIKMKKYDAENTLYHQMREAGIFAPNEVDGGHRLEIKAGVVLDTRDNEAAPNRGIWAELYANGSPSVTGDGYHYLRLAAHFRHYVTLFKDRAVLAYHLGYQGLVAGKAPFYTLQNISTLYLRQTCTDGLGGINTVRGLLAQRLVGNGYAWLNSEIRVRLVSFNFIGQSWYVAVNPLFDAGLITQAWNKDALTAYYGLDTGEFKHQAHRIHMSAGGGVKLAMNQNFIVSAEVAAPFKKTDGDPAVYIALNYIF